MSFFGFPPYVPVGVREAKADRQIVELKKKNPNLAPVLLKGNAIASSWWGKAWNTNLESYADYENRIGRGRSYVRHHAVLDLQILPGKVEALVQGGGLHPYQITVSIDALDGECWKRMVSLCNHQIGSIEDLIAGKFPRELEQIFTDKSYGMFPTPAEIHFSCSCPDYAYMCKHVAAVLYGVGARLDQEPLLFFTLRNVDVQDLIRRSIEDRMESMLENAGKKTDRVISESEMHDIFGI